MQAAEYSVQDPPAEGPQVFPVAPARANGKLQPFAAEGSSSTDGSGLAHKGTAMECFKSCCRNFMMKGKEPQETQVIAVKMPPAGRAPPGRGGGDGRRSVGVSEDYLLSKLPPDGREVPFVLPTFKPSYIQPRGPRYPDLQPGPQGSARSTYAERKAELSAGGRAACDPEPGSSRRGGGRPPSRSHRPDALGGGTSSPRSPAVRELKSGRERLSSSALDLSSPQGRMQRFDSVSSVQSSASSALGSIESSLESVALSGDERDLGKVCVRLSFQEDVEQVWITLVQCSDLNLPAGGGGSGQEPRIGFKGVITMSKPVQFKSSVKECVQGAVFMETFVFALRLQQLRRCSLVLRLQTHGPRKRTAAECVLPLRHLGPLESEHWLELGPPSKSTACRSELHLASCFQAVNGRVQLQVMEVQNLPVSSSPLSQVFFVKAELQAMGRTIAKKKTRALKSSGRECQWRETFHFLLPAVDHAPTLSIKLYSRSSVGRKQCLGEVRLSSDSSAPAAAEQWTSTMSQPEVAVAAWHRLGAS